MNQDATKTAWDDLENPDLYEVKRGVPIFRAHRRTVKDSAGTIITIVVSDDDLPLIARNMAELIAESGVPARINDGHVSPSPDVPESMQPALLGFATHPRFGTFGPKNTPCVMVDTHIRRDKLAIARERPFRSAEYYPGTKTIRGVALLLRDPQLDLGIVTYVADDQSLDPTEQSMEPQKKEEPAEQFSPEESQQYEKICRYFRMKGYMAAGPSAPAAGNTAPPEAEKKPELVPHLLTAQPELYAKLEAAEKRIADLIREQERQKCSALIDKLKVDFKLDADVELAALLTKTPAERDKHVAYIKATHALQDEQIQVYSGFVEGGLSGRPTTEETMKRAVSVATKKGIEYDAALELIKAGKA